MSAFSKRVNAIRAVVPNATVTEERGCIRLTGTADSWDAIVKAGQLAVDKKRYRGVLNDIRLTGYEQIAHAPAVTDDRYEGRRPDVLIVGGGITGCAIARELTRYKLDVMLLERCSDVACGASSHNGGVVHVGINFSKGSQKHLYNARGNGLYDELTEQLGVPFERKGQVLLQYARWERIPIALLCLNAKRLGIPGVRYVDRAGLLAVEPHAPDWARGGVFMPIGGITCPHGMTVALAENAVQNGAEICLDTAVRGMDVERGAVRAVHTNRGTVYPKLVINAAGVYADRIAEMAGDRTFTIHPRKGTDIVLDTKVGYRVRTSFAKAPYTILPYQQSAAPKGLLKRLAFYVGSLKSHTKGVGVIHTVDGNMLVGPNATETPDREDTSTERAIFDDIMRMQQHVTEELQRGDVINYFTGVRAPTYEEDFVVRKGVFTKNVIEAAGIQSPGVTAAPAIAQDVARWAVELLEQAAPVCKNEAFNPVRKPVPALRHMTDEARDALIRENPDYGEIVCRCEQISRGEILDALRSPLPVYTLDAIKRRVRPGMGRCQGGFCSPLVLALIARESGLPVSEIEKGNAGSRVVYLHERNETV